MFWLPFGFSSVYIESVKTKKYHENLILKISGMLKVSRVSSSISWCMHLLKDIRNKNHLISFESTVEIINKDLHSFFISHSILEIF